MGQGKGKPFSVARFYREVRQVLANRSYRMLVIASLFAYTAAGFTDVIGLYMNTYFWEFSSQQLSYMVLVLGLSTIVAVAITRPLSQKYDKKKNILDKK